MTNTSKEMSCYSDFPFQEEYSNYMNQAKFWEYLRTYTEHFDLLKYIRFRTTVCSVMKHPDFVTTGQWVVVTESEGNRETTVFDAVMICTGLFLNAFLPLESFPGIKKFQGQVLHSQEYRTPEDFRGKRILVIGTGNTGGDVAVELGRTAARVFLSTRSGTWVISRLSDDGYPLDLINTTRFRHLIRWLLPSAIWSRMVEKRLNKWFNHENYGLHVCKGWRQKPIVNDELPSSILCGTVTVKVKVKEFTETSAVFEDGTVEDVDVVLFATGYTSSFPFLEEPTRSICRKKIFLHKCVFPSNLEKSTLAVIGHIHLSGSILTATELQARWVTRVFKGLCEIPPSSTLMASAAKKEQLIKQGVLQDSNIEKMDYITYMDELARSLGVKPNILLLFLKDPKLGLKVFFGPCSPYQYRLTGPGKWDGARKAILTLWDRVLKPLQTRLVLEPARPPSTSNCLKVWGPPVLLAATAGLLVCKFSSLLGISWIGLKEKSSAFLVSMMRW
ncbi:dimethylaniline monooxygenase [N-oxide-forming] 4-like isoform X2 [Tachyglossus aculeatus]|nr:dimethylaniline monooxygenase [N-oxide-forming] 4-like isoform X2 [Tachyglossus aculeatus]